MCVVLNNFVEVSEHVPGSSNSMKSVKIPKGVIRKSISKKNRQQNEQKKEYKRTNYDLQNIHIKLKVE